MLNLKFQIGQIIKYTNGTTCIYKGQIVKIKEKSLIIISDKSEMELFKAGFAVGSEISFNQVKNN
jgi:urease accessory protein UreE